MPRPPRAGLKEDLIATAVRQIADHGLQTLTARALAQSASCSVGSIYNMFEDLDDVIVTVHGLTLERLHKALAGSIAPSSSAEANLQALAQRYIAFIADNRELWTAIFEHKLPHGRDVPAWYQAKLNALFALIETVIEPLLPDTGERRRQARILWSSLHGICSLGAMGKLDLISEESTGKLAVEMVRTYVAGLSLRTGRP
jgi:AcrR family transcriptional regulator